MSRYAFVLTTQNDRQKLASWAFKLPTNTRVELKEPKRTVDQNDLMWALLTEVSRAVVWHGLKLNPDDWKLIFLDALRREVRIVPNIDNNGFVNLGRSSSDLSKAEFSDLIEIIRAFGAKHGVRFKDEGQAA